MKRLKITLLILTALSLPSCESISPEERLPPQTMQTFILNTTLIESSKTQFDRSGARRDSLDIKVKASYTGIYKKLSITPRQIRKSHDYYTKYPEEYIGILKAVLDSLKTLEKDYKPKDSKEQ